MNKCNLSERLRRQTIYQVCKIIKIKLTKSIVKNT